MKYSECEKIIKSIDKDKLQSILEDDVDEIFIASSDFNEAVEDLKLIHKLDYNAPEHLLTSKQQDFGIYYLSDDGVLSNISIEELAKS
jgi:hypothetical protein